MRLAVFIIVYLLATAFVLPLLSPLSGRVPLPYYEKRSLQPLTVWTCLLNRNYVKPELRDVLYNAAERMNKRYPGTVINYLDTGFPFFKWFPLFPHLSHHDGEKADIALCYRLKETGERTNGCPSPIGYGISEGPEKKEIDMPGLCKNKGYWQYNLLSEIMPQSRKRLYRLDEERTRDLVVFFTVQKSIGKIFIEPHLKERLGLGSKKIRFHGCQAVRHDDHIHIQL